ncbi:MAG: protein-L-isoaspartate(D-aspartate) O-methyltransferase [Gammaproteobacteria bacterium]
MSVLHRGIGMTSQRTRERLIKRLQEQGIRHNALLEVMRDTPRHIFVDEALASRAYEDTALPIGFGQTISQPYVVARMTEALLNSGPLNKVLEIGTGSGYQAAILAQFAGQVFTVERINALLQYARVRFTELKLRNIQAKHSNGSWGWPDHAPYDAIIVTAAPTELPQALLDQLGDQGRLVIPVGERGLQELVLITRTAQGYEQENLGKVSFVPLRAGPIH